MEFTPQEVEAYFQWFIGIRLQRIAYLQAYLGVALDYSIDSLIDIWSWFLSIAEIEKLLRM